jgi:hypothetical protein
MSRFDRVRVREQGLNVKVRVFSLRVEKNSGFITSARVTRASTSVRVWNPGLSVRMRACACVRELELELERERERA